MKYFNTTGPINPEQHYYIPHRLNWDQLKSYIQKGYYYLLHAPRQSGKTSAIREFILHLNSEDAYTALYISTEAAHVAVNNINDAMRTLLQTFKGAISQQLSGQLETSEIIDAYLKEDGVPATLLQDFLTQWAEKNNKPLVLFFDEVDGMQGDSLISLLKQIRSGFSNRPKHFPLSICFIGVRDLRDYKIQTKHHENLGLLYSPFNIKADSIRLNDFTLEEIRKLYEQHTEATEQAFTDDAIEYAFELTQGQPWLVNALAYQACFRQEKNTPATITRNVIENAKDAIILRRDTHIDALLDRLHDPRVRKIIDSIIMGQTQAQKFFYGRYTVCTRPRLD